MFEKFLLCQAKTHNSFGVLDAAKMCYQAANGVAHIISEKARECFYKEYESAVTDAPVFEEIGGGFVRVNLGGWKAESLNPDWLYRLLCKTAEQNGRGDLEDRLNAVTSLAERGEMPFSLAEWQDFLETYDRTPPSHSMEYKAQNNPLYRVIKRDYVNLLPILKKCAKSNQKPTVIAIDGNAASGKTTLCKLLCEVLPAESVQMDHFFLPPSKRTAVRLKETGGNIDYERFCEEVLPFVREDFEYTRYDCSKLDFSGKIKIQNGDFLIVEGSYSLHPKFRDYADIKIFCEIDSETQMERIIKRNGPELARRFRLEWLPMENKYFEEFNIKKKCDIILR